MGAGSQAMEASPLITVRVDWHILLAFSCADATFQMLSENEDSTGQTPESLDIFI